MRASSISSRAFFEVVRGVFLGFDGDASTTGDVVGADFDDDVALLAVFDDADGITGQGGDVSGTLGFFLNEFEEEGFEFDTVTGGAGGFGFAGLHFFEGEFDFFLESSLAVFVGAEHIRQFALEAEERGGFIVADSGFSGSVLTT